MHRNVPGTCWYLWPAPANHAARTHDPRRKRVFPMSTARSRRKSLFDSDEEDEVTLGAENLPVSATLSASTSSGSLNNGNTEENAVNIDQNRLSKLEYQNSRALFSSDEEDEEEDVERPRASSSAT